MTENAETFDAQWTVNIQARGVSIKVELPNELDLGEPDAERLETELTDAVAGVLAPYIAQ